MNENFLSLIFPDKDELSLAEDRWKEMMQENFSDELIATMTTRQIDIRLLAGYVRFLVFQGDPNNFLHAHLSVSLAYRLGYMAHFMENEKQVLGTVFDIWGGDEEE